MNSVIFILFYGIIFVQSEKISPTRIQLCPGEDGNYTDLPQTWKNSVENLEILKISTEDLKCTSLAHLNFDLPGKNYARNKILSDIFNAQLGDILQNYGVSKGGKVILYNSIILPEDYCILSTYSQNGLETVKLRYCSPPACSISNLCVNMCLPPNWAFKFNTSRLLPTPSDLTQLENWWPEIETRANDLISRPKIYPLEEYCKSSEIGTYIKTYKWSYPYPSTFTLLEFSANRRNQNFRNMINLRRSPTNREEWTNIKDPWCVGPVLDSDGGFSGDWAAIVCESKPKVNELPNISSTKAPVVDEYAIWLETQLYKLNSPISSPPPQSKAPVVDEYAIWLENQRNFKNSPSNTFSYDPQSKKCPSGGKDSPRPHPGGIYALIELPSTKILSGTGGKPSNETAAKGPNDIVYMFATNAFFHGLTALVYLLLWDKLDLYGYLVLAMTAAFASALGMQASILDNDIEQYWPPESMSCIIRAIILNFMLIHAFSWLLMIAYDFWSQLNSLTTKIARWPPLGLFLAYGFLALSLPLAVVITGRIKDINFKNSNDTEVIYQCDRLGFPITGGAGYGLYSCSLLESAMGPYLYYIEIGIMAAMWIFMGLTFRNLSQIEEKSAKITTLHNEFKVYMKVLIIITITSSIEIFSWANKSTGNEWYCTFLKKINSCAGLPIFLVFVLNKGKLDQVAEKWPFLAGLRDRFVGISATVNKVQGFSRISKMVRGGKKGPKDVAGVIDEENPRQKRMVKKPSMPPDYDDIEVVPEKTSKFQKMKENQGEIGNRNKIATPSGEEENHLENEAPSGDEDELVSIEIDAKNDDEIQSDEEENFTKK